MKNDQNLDTRLRSLDAARAEPAGKPHPGASRPQRAYLAPNQLPLSQADWASPTTRPNPRPTADDEPSLSEAW